ncbi:MAG: hypothetical protein QOJ63_372 [Solirubrobacteraceae bacterium]|jgi:hypothetical protein|nr:hypothetical protein [Solirubrobacteraceae bacterium]
MNRHDDDLENLGQQLRAAASDPSEAQLARVRRRALGSAERRASRARPGVLIALLTAGILTTSAGATMAVSGISSRQDASVAQYGGGVVPANGTVSGVSGGSGAAEAPGGSGAGEAPGGSDTVGGVTTGSGGPAPAAATLADTPTSAAAPNAEQPVLDSGSLPFTGYAGIAALLLGLGLLGAGLVLRRGSRPLA